MDTQYKISTLVAAILSGESSSKVIGDQGRAFVDSLVKGKKKTAKNFLKNLGDSLHAENQKVRDLLDGMIQDAVKADPTSYLKEYEGRPTKFKDYDNYRKSIQNQLKKYRIAGTVTGSSLSLMPSIAEEKALQEKADKKAKKEKDKKDCELAEFEAHKQAVIEADKREQEINTLPKLQDYLVQRLSKLSAHYMEHAAKCGLSINDSESAFIESLQGFLVSTELAHGMNAADTTTAKKLAEKYPAKTQDTKAA